MWTHPYLGFQAWLFKALLRTPGLFPIVWELAGWSLLRPPGLTSLSQFACPFRPVRWLCGSRPVAGRADADGRDRLARARLPFVSFRRFQTTSRRVLRQRREEAVRARAVAFSDVHGAPAPKAK
ncbi:hypothetical protein SEVIR_7G210450v4 [Setaria viridis]